MVEFLPIASRSTTYDSPQTEHPCAADDKPREPSPNLPLHWLEVPPHSLGQGLLSPDPQLICYSWISGIPNVALVVFVRKHAPEIQYLRASISEEQRQEFGRLVETTIGQIEAAQFVSHSGIRFPQNGCLSCPHLGLCLNNQALVDTNLVRKAGASDLDWLDELAD